ISAGVHLLPNKALPERRYGMCRQCNRLYLQFEAAVCAQCGDHLDRGTFVEPIFGFVAGDPDASPLGDERPRRLYGTRVLFNEYGDIEPMARATLSVGPGRPTVLGRFSRNGSLAVVNDGRGR